MSPVHSVTHVSGSDQGSVDLQTAVVQLETHLTRKEVELAYQDAVMVVQLARRQRNQQDPLPGFEEAQSRARLNPSFQNYYALSVAAYRAKRYQESIDAAEAAWQLRDKDELISKVADGLHSSQQVGAMAALESGRVDSAVNVLLRSVDVADRRWLTSKPQMGVAQRLLERNERKAVESYLEACLRSNWGVNQATLQTWLAEIRSGKTPSLRFPI